MVCRTLSWTCVWGKRGAFSFGTLNWGLNSETWCWQKELCHPQLLFGKHHAISLRFDLQLEETQFLGNSELGHFISSHKAKVSNKICLMPFFPIYFYLVFGNQNNLRVLKINNSSIHYCASLLIFLGSCQLINREGLLSNSVVFFITWYWHTGYCFMI